MNNSPYLVPYDYMRSRCDSYVPDTTGEQCYWDNDGYPFNTLSASHGRLDAPDKIASGSMIGVLTYDYPWDSYISLPSVAVRGE